MKKNLYYKDQFGRENGIKKFIVALAIALCSPFRIPIEMLIRKNFGERYFSVLQSLAIGIALIYLPAYWSSNFGQIDESHLLKHFATSYIYAALYWYCLYKRYQEIKREPSVFDFARFSLSTGHIHPFFLNIKTKGRFNPRMTEIVYEPGVFFLAGAILAAASQPLGFLFMACALMYSLGYYGAYYIGDNFVMDKIDQMISNEQLSTTFINGNQSEKGFRFYGKRPSDQKLRERLHDVMLDEEDPDDDGVDVE